MFDKFKISLNQILIYSIGNVATKLTGFVLFPIYASNFHITEYRSLILLEPVWQLLTALLAISLPTALLRWLPMKKSNEEQKSLVYTVLVSLLAILILFNLIAFPVNQILANNNLYFSPDFKKYMDLTFPLVSFDILNLLILSLLRFYERPWLYISLNLTKLSVNIILNVYLITFKGMGIEAVIISQLVASILLNFLSLGFLIRNLVPKFNLSALKEMVAFGFPLIFTTISAILLSFSDRYIIDHFFTKVETGVYGVGYKFGSLLNMFVIQSFQLGFLPLAFKMLEDPDAKRFFSRILTYFMLILVFIGMALSIFAKEILTIFSSGQADYKSAYVVVPLITLGFIIKGLQYYLSLGLFYVKKTGYNAWIVMGCAITSIFMNLILVPKFGIYGAAVTLLIITSIMALLYYYYAQKHYPISFEYKRIAMVGAIGFLLFFAGSIQEVQPQEISILFKFACITLFPFLLYFIGFFNSDELKRIKEFKDRHLMLFKK